MRQWHGTFSANVSLLHIPPRGPDLNPVEEFWGWLHKELRRMDLADLVAKQQPVGKTAFKERERRLCNSATARIVAGNYARNLRNVCQVVIQKKGRASGF